jgi:hypothetical protein
LYRANERVYNTVIDGELGFAGTGAYESAWGLLPSAECDPVWHFARWGGAAHQRGLCKRPQATIILSVKSPNFFDGGSHRPEGEI